MTDCWDQLVHPPDGVDVHFIRAGKSDRWGQPAVVQQLNDVARLHGHPPPHHPQQHPPPPDGPRHAGSFHLHVLPQADHNVHISDPEGLLRLVLPRLMHAVRP